jgi:hypothetical protein
MTRPKMKILVDGGDPQETRRAGFRIADNWRVDTMGVPW